MCRSSKPLIHCITNPISMNQCANTILALGGRPIMAEHPDEVEEVTETASALLLNMGNISDTKMQSMKIAIETANRLNIPVVIDAVGVACSRMRLSFVKMLLDHHRAAVVKGNYSEIYALYDNKYRASGIDVRSGLAKDEVISAASFLACEYSLITVASGKTDIITDGQEILELNCGCSQMAEVTGTGCMQGAAIAAALSFGVSIKAVADVCEFFGRAGERAATDKGNGTFMVNLINELGAKMKFNSELYFITDSTKYELSEFYQRVELALQGGVTMLQLREKSRTTREYIEIAERVHEIAKRYCVPLIIDDRADVMLAVDAEGVHVGAEDMKVQTLRRIIGKDKIVGATAKTVEAAVAAYGAGADYLGVGAIYPTTTKVKTVLTSVDTLKDICRAVPIAVNAIGGLNKDNLTVLKDTGIAGICAVSSIMHADDPKIAAKEMKENFEKIKRRIG